MKNKFFALVVVLVSLVGLTANAQMKLGGSLAYATDLNGMGITVNGVYQLNDKWEIAPSFTYYFKKNDILTWWSLDANAHYVFVSDSKYDIYAIGGLGILGAKAEYMGYSASSSTFGINMGVGGRLNFNDKLAGLGEFKFFVGDGSYAAFNFGVLYSL